MDRIGDGATDHTKGGNEFEFVWIEREKKSNGENELGSSLSQIRLITLV